MHTNHELFNAVWEASYTETPFRRDIDMDRFKNAAKTKKTGVRNQLNALISGCTRPYKARHSTKGSIYSPIQAGFDEWTFNWRERDPVTLFLRFLGAECVG